MAKSSLIGKTIGKRYVIEEMLGQGGMSAVYKATDPNLKRVVAIKVIHSRGLAMAAMASPTPPTPTSKTRIKSFQMAPRPM